MRTEEQAASRLINRELSWVEFNGRVLELARGPATPLLERVKFAAIFASNLDEFFMVRVAGLLEQEQAHVGVRSRDGLTPGQALDAIRRRVGELTSRQSRLWKRELVPALAGAGIEIATVEDCSERDLKRARHDLRARDLPGAHAARRRPGTAVPVHLGPVALPRGDRGRPGLGRRALRPCEGARGPAPASSRSASASCRWST